MRIVFVFILLLYFFSTILLRAQVSPGELKITYVSNSGFLLTSQNHKVLIDALSINGATSLKDITSGIMEDKPPFNNVSLFILSHYNADQCDPYMVNFYLLKHEKILLVASKPAISYISSVCYDFRLRKKQFFELTPDVNKSAEGDVNGIFVKAFGLKYNTYFRNGILTDESSLNVSYLFDMDGIRVFHSGHIKSAALKAYLSSGNKWTDRTDVALLCYDMLESNEEDLNLIVSTLHPQYIVIMHVPSEFNKACESKIEMLKSIFPNIIFLKNRMESRLININMF